MAGNWKMNLNHLEAIALVQKLAFALTDQDFDAVNVCVIPPFTDLRSIQTLIDGDGYRIAYGAQDLSIHDFGAFTGEISGAMLARLGCTYVLAGHSERRQYHGEGDDVVGAKVRAAFRHGIVPILCVGESLEIRRAGDQVAYTSAQVAAALDGLSPEQVGAMVVAYEPVWAIGTGEVATPADAQEVCAAIRQWVADFVGSAAAETLRVLYGGSVKLANVAGIMAEPDVDGALVGGASLDPDEFVGLVRYRLVPAEPAEVS
ncbi:MAG: triose-phosphate isomerase [Actinobacteria bacterium]|nr:triose-phosphate isomerase [Actinomycetota bacterium]